MSKSYSFVLLSILLIASGQVLADPTVVPSKNERAEGAPSLYTATALADQTLINAIAAQTEAINRQTALIVRQALALEAKLEAIRINTDNIAASMAKDTDQMEETVDPDKAVSTSTLKGYAPYPRACRQLSHTIEAAK